MGTKITDRYFEFDGRKYFRVLSHEVCIGNFGKKKAPFGNYLEPFGRVKSEFLAPRVVAGPPVEIDWSQTTKASLEANGRIKIFGINGKVDSNGTYEKLKGAQDLKLANFYILPEPLKRMLNKDANVARNWLAEEGNDGRIASEVWVVMEGELAEQFRLYGQKSLAVKAIGQELKITVTGEKNVSQTITYSPGATFAYKLHKVKKWNDNKTEIEEMEEDYYNPFLR